MKKFILTLLVFFGFVALPGCAAPVDSADTATAPAVVASTPPAVQGETVAPETPVVEETPEAPPVDEGTVSQQNALRSAQSYLEFSSFSKAGLFDQLTSEYGEAFPAADAKWAIARLDVDWNQEAVEAAESYLEFSSFSRQGLIDQLTSEYGDQFTKEQALYAVNAVGL